MDVKNLLTEANKKYVETMNLILRPETERYLQELISNQVAQFIESRNRQIEEALSKVAPFQDEDICEITELKYGEDFKLYDTQTVIALMSMMCRVD